MFLTYENRPRRYVMIHKVSCGQPGKLGRTKGYRSHATLQEAQDYAKGRVGVGSGDAQGVVSLPDLPARNLAQTQRAVNGDRPDVVVAVHGLGGKARGPTRVVDLCAVLTNIRTAASTAGPGDPSPERGGHANTDRHHEMGLDRRTRTRRGVRRRDGRFEGSISGAARLRVEQQGATVTVSGELLVRGPQQNLDATGTIDGQGRFTRTDGVLVHRIEESPCGWMDYEGEPLLSFRDGTAEYGVSLTTERCDRLRLGATLTRNNGRPAGPVVMSGSILDCPRKIAGGGYTVF